MSPHRTTHRIDRTRPIVVHPSVRPSIDDDDGGIRARRTKPDPKPKTDRIDRSIDSTDSIDRPTDRDVPSHPPVGRPARGRESTTTTTPTRARAVGRSVERRSRAFGRSVRRSRPGPGPTPARGPEAETAGAKARARHPPTRVALSSI